MEKSVRTRLFTAAVLVIVFGTGLVSGMALSHGMAAEPEDAVAARPPATDSTGRSHREPMYEQVGPTEAQRVRIDSIVKQNHEAMRALTKEFHQAFDPRYENLVTGTRAAIRSVLTPEQAMKYDSLLAASDRRRAERGARGNRE
jgi:Spy/CpxP family protein refolding chaperone